MPTYKIYSSCANPKVYVLKVDRQKIYQPNNLIQNRDAPPIKVQVCHHMETVYGQHFSDVAVVIMIFVAIVKSIDIINLLTTL